jgi:trehalose 6-phosphate phosphatase
MQPSGLEAVVAVASRLCEEHPALLLEVKSAAVALHYRQAPELEALCLEVMSDAAAGHDALTVLRGKRVVEVKPKRASKAEAVRTFMAEAPFEGRVPCFVGDDVTDEVAFEAVQTEGGMAVKIGAGDTIAFHRLTDPAAVHDWLKRSLDGIRATSRDDDLVLQVGRHATPDDTPARAPVSVTPSADPALDLRIVLPDGDIAPR